MSHYVSWNGLTEVSRRVAGNETIGVGIRPYGLHAGNLASVVAYPYLFLENFEKSKKTPPRFKFQVWLNDIEPVTYVGADGRPESADWANMYPGNTSFQMTPAPNGFKGNLTDYWQSAIEGVVRGTIGVRFPKVVVEFRRASELVTTPEFEKMVVGCIKESESVKAAIDSWNYGVAEVEGPSSFVWPLCPDCHTPIVKPKLKLTCPKTVPLISTQHKSTEHNHISKMPVDALLWAVQFRMLHAVRLAAIQPSIWFMGMDHVPTNLGRLMEDLADIFGIDEYRGHFLHAPLLFAGKNKKLSKSLGNAVYMPLEELFDALRNNRNSGLDMTCAPVSSDIMSIGPGLLPKHMTTNKWSRIMAIEKEKFQYARSGKRAAFRDDNVPGAISDFKVASMLGVPHLH